jgi:colanic acid/amylovoran biosynthesis glycosyltransferase
MPADLDWSLDVIGDGPLQHRLEDVAAGLPVRFLGRRGRADLSAALARASVVVVPSVPTASGDQDGLPVALLEAMGSGKAVVASRLPGIDEAVQDGVSGLLVPPGDPDALAAALTRVLTDADLRERLGRAASQAAEEHSVSAVGRRYVEVLRSVAAGR